MKKRILVDMDGVLADDYSRFFDLHEEESGVRLSVNDIAGLLEAEAFPNQVKWVTTPGFFRNVPIMPGSREGLKQLNDNFKVIVVSLATEFPSSLTDKLLWLNEHYPFISWKQIVFCGSKELIQAEIMIDDHIKNLDCFKGETIMFTQPHNVHLTDVHHRRVYSWAEIVKILLP
jgi:5'(3')-deoxyribonucleotidase